MSDLTGLNEFTRVLNIVSITTTNSTQIEREKKRKDTYKEILKETQRKLEKFVFRWEGNSEAKILGTDTSLFGSFLFSVALTKRATNSHSPHQRDVITRIAGWSYI
jgi:hypothetical protein